MIKTSIFSDEQFTAKVVVEKDSTGTPLVLNEKPAWTSSGGGCKVDAADDGLSATIVPDDESSVSVVKVSFSSGEGDAKKDFVQEIEVTVVDKKQGFAKLNLSDPVPKVAAVKKLTAKQQRSEDNK